MVLVQVCSTINFKNNTDPAVRNPPRLLEDTMARTLLRILLNLFIVSPEGEQFNNRRKALVEMVRRGMQEEDLDLMRLEMEKEGWKVLSQIQGVFLLVPKS